MPEDLDPVPAHPEPALSLTEDRSVPWRPVSPRLVRVRGIAAAISFLVVLVPLVVVSVMWWRWAWLAVAAVALLWAWCQWLITRQVPAITYAELPDELAIRKGRVLRTMVTIPYGRIQYVDVSAGPLLRAHGLAGIEVHTASPSSSGDIPGLPADEAEALRERLSALGESRRAGL